MLETLLTLAEAAERLRVSVRTVEREAKDGRIAIVRIRSRRMIDPAELLRYIAANQTTAPTRSAAGDATATRAAAASAMAAAADAHLRRLQLAPKRGRSRSRLGAPGSTPRAVTGSKA